ncbi:MAG TPA: undecaprenyl-diphosphate phosphatase [Fastidiosipila sp.]|nr:undecaprenyl-diphosphate phosphatase [Fastidiosipila sp.]
MVWIDVLKALLYGIVEGITEWLPVSSTGHLILLENWLPLGQGADFFSLFLVVIQFGAILAVVFLFFSELWPFLSRSATAGEGTMALGPLRMDKGKLSLWAKILVACVPAVIIGLLFDDFIEEHLHNHVTVAIMLIVVGAMFIVAEHLNRNKRPDVLTLSEITYKHAIIIGLFQVIAAVLPGTSRSGATILGAILIGLSRQNAAKFTFFLAVPVMLGASLLRFLRLGFSYTGGQWLVLFIGTAVSFLVSMFAVKFLLNYVRNRDFKPFAYYRIALGVLVLLVFFIS